MRKLTIGIDGYNLALRHGTGVSTYSYTVASVLSRAGHDIVGLFGVDPGLDPNLREVLFFDRLRNPNFAPRLSDLTRRQKLDLYRIAGRPWLRVKATEIGLTDRVEKAEFEGRMPDFDRLLSVSRLFQMAFLHFRLFKRFVSVVVDNPPDVMHWTYPVPVEVEGTRNVYTMHDLVPLRLPYLTMDGKRSYARIVEQCARRASHICTISETSRRDIVDLLGVDSTRVTNTYQTTLPPTAILDMSQQENGAMVEGIFGLKPQGYFLFVGALEPKKNVGRLIEAYLSTQTTSPLVIAGPAGWNNEDELRLVSGSQDHLTNRVIRVDYLPRTLLLRLIRSARAVLFPSLYEGFGLPVLEAMQMGTPVLTSTTSSLPEVAGDGAVLVDPYDTAAIAAGLRALDEDAALRERLSAGGLARAETFSEANYVRRLEAMYAAVLGEPGSRAERSPAPAEPRLREPAARLPVPILP